ncbi:MAG: Ig-like domain-containing protein [Mycobacteriaceae bacterium]
MGAAGFSARVGAAAFLVGLSLSAPQTIAVAAADDTPSPSASTSASDDNASGQDATRPTARGTRIARPSASAARSAAPSAAQRAGTPNAPAAAQRSRVGNRAAAAVTPRTLPQRSVATTSDPANPQPVQVNTAPAAGIPVTETPGAPAALVTPARTAAAQVGIAGAGVRVGKAISPASATDAGPLGQIQSFLEGIGLLIRRTFFNKPPTVAPVQTSSLVNGTITGTLGATDPEGDPLSYSVSGSPANGSVTVASDGTYTYTAGSGFNGLDAFTVAVTDQGFHINLLDLFRPTSTEAYTQVSKGSGVTFSFIYGEGSQYWSTDARNALQQAAYALASYVLAAQPVSITYNVTAFSNGSDGTLASAGSDLAGSGSGFFPTLVQQKIQTGVDANGSGVDGEIDWNFGQPWGYGSVSGSQYDFTSTEMHELLHTFGFLSYIDPAYASDTQWTTFDKFIVNSADVPVINRATFLWNGTFADLYFAGPNAVAVYGGKVPLYSPSPYESGSSISHLRDSTFVGSNEKLMNSTVAAGPGVRKVSPLEQAILKDLGYTVSDTPIYLFVVGFTLIRRRRKTS